MKEKIATILTLGMKVLKHLPKEEAHAAYLTFGSNALMFLEKNDFPTEEAIAFSNELIKYYDQAFNLAQASVNLISEDKIYDLLDMAEDFINTVLDKGITELESELKSQA